MLQSVDGREVFVVDFDTMPKLPITWDNLNEQPYAEALAKAIQDKVITKPGKYGIHIETSIDPHTSSYTIYTITEKEIL